MTLRLTEEEFARLKTNRRELFVIGQSEDGKKKRAKYRNNKCEYDGKKFDSEREKNRYIDLKFMERANEIADVQCQVKFELIPAAYLEGEKRKKRALNYIADFTYKIVKTGKLVVEDVKSVQTKRLQSYRIKKHLMKTQHDIDVVEY